MTTPREEQPQAQPAPEPTVSTAPPGRRRHSIPSHVGPARTSTVILAVLWLALGALYLNVRPPTPATAAGTSVESPAPAGTAPRTASSAPPSTTSGSSTTSRSSAASSTPSTAPETTTAPSETTTVPLETSSPPGTVPEPTTGLAPTS